MLLRLAKAIIPYTQTINGTGIFIGDMALKNCKFKQESIAKVVNKLIGIQIENKQYILKYESIQFNKNK